MELDETLPGHDSDLSDNATSNGNLKEEVQATTKAADV